MLLRSMIRSALILGTFAVAGVAVVALSFDATHERIEENERAALLRSIHEVLRVKDYDNDIFTDSIRVRSPSLLGAESPVPVYRARMQGKPVAVVLTPVAPDGYNGNIRLIVGIYFDGTLGGVRVIAHQETPGLGDAIDERRSDWITRFAGLSLKNPPPEKWKVKRDGGVFDQFTGATITPRAVVGAVRRTLEYFKAHRDALFARLPAAGAGTRADGG